jgi:hypothetical protein
MDEKLVERVIVRGIHVYQFNTNTRQAADEYLKLADPDIQAHIDAGNINVPFLYILDVSRSGMFSVNYMRQRVNQLVESKEYWPESYIAYVTNKPDDSVLVNLIDALTSRELDHTRKVFKTEQFDQAVDWLLSVQKKFEDT